MFCLDYYPHQAYLKEVEQLKIYYRRTDTSLKDFLEEYKDKSIVIDIDDSFEEIDANLFETLYTQYQNFKLIVSYMNLSAIELIKERKIPFFFRDYVGTIDKLHMFIKEGVTDIYVCEQLGFSLDSISKLLHNNNIKVRVIPNLCQSSCTSIPSILQFFVRPEDIDFYSQFVDIFEIVTPHPQQSTIYKIYKQGYWAGAIKEIIPNFKDDLDSRFLLNHFGVMRCSCGKRCMYRQGSCNICYRFMDVAAAFQTSGIMIKKKTIDS